MMFSIINPCAGMIPAWRWRLQPKLVWCCLAMLDYRQGTFGRGNHGVPLTCPSIQWNSCIFKGWISRDQTWLTFFLSCLTFIHIHPLSLSQNRLQGKFTGSSSNQFACHRSLFEIERYVLNTVLYIYRLGLQSSDYAQAPTLFTTGHDPTARLGFMFYRTPRCLNSSKFLYPFDYKWL
jgi:hypothetical protein